MFKLKRSQHAWTNGMGSLDSSSFSGERQNGSHFRTALFFFIFSMMVSYSSSIMGGKDSKYTIWQISGFQWTRFRLNVDGWSEEVRWSPVEETGWLTDDTLSEYFGCNEKRIVQYYALHTSSGIDGNINKREFP